MPPKKRLSLADTLTSLRTGKDPVEIGSLAEFAEDALAVRGRSMGNISLDAVTGIGGVPEGRVCEFVGPPSSGKTTAALQAMAKSQQNGEYVVYMDYEKTFDEEYAVALGLDPRASTFVYMRPKTFEHGANIARKLVATGEVGVVTFDSVASMVTENEQNADTGAVKVADRAKMMHQFLRQFVTPLNEFGTTAIFLNHQMEVVDATPMGQKMAARGIKRYTSPGGKALPFYSSLRLEFKQIGNLRVAHLNTLTGEKEDQVRQTKTQVTVLKNKVGDPFGQVELRVRFGRGFSQPYSVLSILKAHGVVVEKGQPGNHVFPPDLLPPSGKESIRGEENILAALEDDEEWLSRCTGKAEEVLTQFGVEKVDLIVDQDGNAIDGDVDEILAFDSESGELS